MYKIKSTPEDFVVKEEHEPKIVEDGDFAYFRLRKKGYSTEEVIQIIKRIGQVPERFINYSGLKDKHAVTEQYISIRKEFAKRIKEINLKDISFEFLGNGKERMTLGTHSTNHFELVIRHLSIKDAPTIPTSIPNYFDEQRFSSVNPEVGRHIVKKEFDEACKLLSKIDLSMERSVRDYLQSNEKDYVGALRKIPKRTLLLYVHAYQALLFNRLLSRYVELASKDYWIMQYSRGGFYFPADRIVDKMLPVIGFGTDSKIASDIMEEEGIIARDFIIKQIPELTTEGTMRSALMSLNNVKVEKPEPDELNPGKTKCKVEFSLGRGCYATIVIRSIFGKA